MSKPEKPIGRRRSFVRRLAGAEPWLEWHPLAPRPNSANKQAIRWDDHRSEEMCGLQSLCAAARRTILTRVAYNIVMEEEVGTYPDVRRRFILGHACIVLLHLRSCAHKATHIATMESCRRL
jgi:hypothetical protein